MAQVSYIDQEFSENVGSQQVHYMHEPGAGWFWQTNGGLATGPFREFYGAMDSARVILVN